MNPAPSVAATYGRTADGDLAALVDDTAYAAIPGPRGLRIANAWRLSKPMSEWRRDDFHGAIAMVADAVGFHDHIAELVQHREELLRLDRKRCGGRRSTPWGQSQSNEIYADGVVFHSTASHGGFKLDRARNAKMPAALRVAGGWYEEDAEWSKVAAGFPHLFTAYERRHAEKTLRDYYPNCWEAIHGRFLKPGESVENDRRLFHQKHRQDWVVVSAIHSKDHPDMTDCIARLGGRRDHGHERRFLVPSREYVVGRFGFVIDEVRHKEV
ncbi:hypothetical protein BHE75_02086 [Sphingomonas haloaromaticamans]|uniref:DUF7007 domain-containing protein n=2 Tax=Edaphosphingomonas haloaromaticamans TaxID=653954 RepID=A0A1S1HE58_9SPHN|nr:hypothetical protein BHE75_02086 [Sphingomonas haloaromaticamans]